MVYDPLYMLLIRFVTILMVLHLYLTDTLTCNFLLPFIFQWCLWSYGMNLGVSHLVQFFGIVWEEQALILLRMFGRIFLCDHPNLGLYLLGIFFITVLISLLVISLCKWSIFFLINYWQIVCLQKFFHFFWVLQSFGT